MMGTNSPFYPVNATARAEDEYDAALASLDNPEALQERTTEFVRIWRNAIFDPELHHLFWEQLSTLYDQAPSVAAMEFDASLKHVDDTIDMWAPGVGDGILGQHVVAYDKGLDAGVDYANGLYHQLPSGGRPRWVVVFDFIDFEIIDKWGKRPTQRLNLEDLRNATNRLGFLFHPTSSGL